MDRSVRAEITNTDISTDVVMSANMQLLLSSVNKQLFIENV